MLLAAPADDNDRGGHLHTQAYCSKQAVVLHINRHSVFKIVQQFGAKAMSLPPSDKTTMSCGCLSGEGKVRNVDFI